MPKRQKHFPKSTKVTDLGIPADTFLVTCRKYPPAQATRVFPWAVAFGACLVWVKKVQSFCFPQSFDCWFF
ncbi:MAG: hypothetical protein D6714_10935 [Bacteroidetes bacterium]|nr:MAG: hypothetical protein D6714_10935 [Bacteroidota bacterium]